MLNEFFQRENIEYFRELPVEALPLLDEKKMERIREKIGGVESVVLFLIPYSVGQKTTNLSVYAQVRDYHLYAKELSGRLAAFLAEKGVEHPFYLAADSSPLDERRSAALAGLGFLGENGLLLTKRYGSFVFIGGIYLSKGFSPKEPLPVRFCPSCGKCREACPTDSIAKGTRETCLSYLSQKKNRSEAEEELVRKATCKWGCDLCQNVCPFNENVEETPVSFFREGLISSLNEDVINLPKEEFEARAFSWRGRELLRKNMEQ